MITIYGRSSSINVQKAVWTAAELGLEVDRVDADGSVRRYRACGYDKQVSGGMIGKRNKPWKRRQTVQKMGPPQVEAKKNERAKEFGFTAGMLKCSFAEGRKKQ